MRISISIPARSRANNYIHVVAGRRVHDVVFFDDTRPDEIVRALDAARARRTELCVSLPSESVVSLVALKRPSSGFEMHGVQFVGLVAGKAG
jgi:hypothetical protein